MNKMNKMSVKTQNAFYCSVFPDVVNLLLISVSQEADFKGLRL